MSVAAPLMMTDLGIGAASTGVLPSAFFWSYTIAQVPAGWLVDRYGAKSVLSCGYALWSVSCAFTGWARSMPMLIASRLALGVGEAPLYPAGFHIAATSFSERHRVLASAIYADGAKLGPAIGAPFAAWLIALVGWREMFVLVAALSLLWLPLWWLIAPAGRPRAETRRAPGMGAEWRPLLTTRAMWGMILGWFGYLYVFYTYATWLPTYLVLARGLTLLKAGWYAALPFIVQFFLSLLGGWAADALIRRGWSPTLVRKGAIGMGLCLALAILPAAGAESGEIALLFFLVALAGMGIASANMFALPPALAPRGYAGLVGAMQNSAGAFGGVVAPIVTGALYERTHSFSTALIATAVMLGLSAVGYLFLVPDLAPIDLSAPGADRSSFGRTLFRAIRG